MGHMNNRMRAELALCFLGLFLGIASFAAPSPGAKLTLAVLGFALSLTMLVRSIRRVRRGRSL